MFWIFSVAKMKVIKEESKALGLLMIDDDLFTCDTPLGIIFNEFNQLSEMDDDLFTYEVKIPKLSYYPCVEKQMDDLDHRNHDVYEWKLCYDDFEKMYAEAVIFINKRFVRLIDVTMEQWLDLKYGDHTMNVLWIYWARGDDEKVITYDELSNLGDGNLIKENEIAQIFRIDTDIFHFETPLYVPWVANMPWLDYGPWMEPSNDIKHIFKPFHFKNRHAMWPTCNWKKEKYCNGGDLPRVIWSRDVTYFKSYEWYENLGEGTNNDYETQTDEGLFDEHKLMGDDDDDIGDLEEYLIRKDPPYYVNEEEERSKERRCKLFRFPYVKPSTCKSEKFEVSKLHNAIRYVKVVYFSTRVVTTFTVIIEQIVKDNQKACILELKRRNHEDTVQTTYTLYPSRKIWRIRALNFTQHPRREDNTPYPEEIHTPY
ncbi:hypothetical protein Tco_1351774 [Tanacetum coccineum]